MQCNIVYSMSVCFCMCIKGHHVCQILNNLTLGESHANMTLGHRVPSSHGGKSAKVRFSFWFLFWYLKLLVSQISFFKQQKVWEGMMLGMFSSISPPPVEFTDFPVFYPFKIGCEIVLGFFFWAGLGFFFGFLGWYHLPSVCNGLELEFVILHGICHIWACSPSILHGIYYFTQIFTDAEAWD